MYATVLNATGTLHPAGCTNKIFHFPIQNASHADAVQAYEALTSAITASKFSSDIPKIISENKNRGTAFPIIQ